MKDAEEATCNKAVQKARQLLEAEPSPRNAALALEHIGAHDVGNQDHVNNPKPDELRIDLRNVLAMLMITGYTPSFRRVPCQLRCI